MSFLFNKSIKEFVLSEVRRRWLEDAQVVISQMHSVICRMRRETSSVLEFEAVYEWNCFESVK